MAPSLLITWGFYSPHSALEAPTYAHYQLVRLPTGPHYDTDTVRQIKEYATQVLRDHHLQYHGIRLVGRNSKIDPEPEPVTTVLVRMPNRPPPELWYRAAKEINQLLLSHHHDGLSVEIIETDLFNGIYCSPVGSRVNVTVVRSIRGAIRLIHESHFEYPET